MTGEVSLVSIVSVLEACLWDVHEHCLTLGAVGLNVAAGAAVFTFGMTLQGFVRRRDR